MTTNHSDSQKARDFVKDTYKKAGGKPTPELVRVYNEYLKHQQTRQQQQIDNELIRLLRQ
jgi:hypothetical protein